MFDDDSDDDKIIIFVQVPNVATSTTVADESSISVKSSSMSAKNVAVIPKLPGGKKVLETVVNMDVDQVYK